MLGKIFDRLNTAITIVGVVYAVSKFMYDTFKKYEKKHGRKNDEGRIQEDIR
jgi:hypothetical protein